MRLEFHYNMKNPPFFQGGYGIIILSMEQIILNEQRGFFMKIKLDRNWTVAGSWTFTVMQGASVETGARFIGVTPVISAKVRGSVYDDLLRAGLIPDPYYERNSLLCEWVANRFWSYQNTFDIPAEICGKRVRLVLKGVDYHAHMGLWYPSRQPRSVRCRLS